MRPISSPHLSGQLCLPAAQLDLLSFYMNQHTLSTRSRSCPQLLTRFHSGVVWRRPVVSWDSVVAVPQPFRRRTIVSEDPGHTLYLPERIANGPKNMDGKAPASPLRTTTRSKQMSMRTALCERDASTRHHKGSGR